MPPWGMALGITGGLVPAHCAAPWNEQWGLLRIPREVELAGLDHTAVATGTCEDDDIRAALAQEGQASVTT